MIRRPPRSTLDRSSAASDVYKRQIFRRPIRPDWSSPGSAGAREQSAALHRRATTRGSEARRCITECRVDSRIGLFPRLESKDADPSVEQLEAEGGIGFGHPGAEARVEHRRRGRLIHCARDARPVAAGPGQAPRSGITSSERDICGAVAAVGPQVPVERTLHLKSGDQYVLRRRSTHDVEAVVVDLVAGDVDVRDPSFNAPWQRPNERVVHVAIVVPPRMQLMRIDYLARPRQEVIHLRVLRADQALRLSEGVEKVGRRRAR